MAGPASSAVDRRVNFFALLVALFCLLPGFIPAQFAANTTVSRVGSTDTFNLSFTQPSPPFSLAGVECLVVVEGTDPSISLHVPSSSWIFEQDDTSLDVGEPTLADGKYRFPITAWRNDNEPQSGSGLYLQVIATDGIVIAIEDFPTKNAQSGVLMPQAGPTTLEEALSKAVDLRVCDLQGHLIAAIGQHDLGLQFSLLWTGLPQGVYLVTVTMTDHTSKTWKSMR